MQSSHHCILVAASTVQNARKLAYRIKAHGNDHTEHQELNDSYEVIPWTIRNKYYTAEVHFKPLDVATLAAIELEDTPALIYAWSETDPFREHVKKVAKSVEEHEFEVSLAILTESKRNDGEIEDIDEFFLGHGFEYVDGRRDSTEPLQSVMDMSGPPDLRRAVDALSTIMWPSMRAATSGKAKAAASAPVDEAELALKQLYADAQQEDDGARRIRIRREMEELEKWLQDDSTEQALEATSPTQDASQLVAAKEAGSSEPEDFDDFVSAPDPAESMYYSIDNPELSTAGHEPEHDQAPSRSALFNVTADENEEDDADEMPTETEIQEASTKIFGPPRPPAENAGPSMQSFEEFDFDSPAFDLSRVFGALQGMKKEIEGITDEKERRKAAAKVALGLVYGLSGEGDPEDLDADFLA